MTQRAERRSKQQWQDIFVQQAQSGLTALQFCQQHDIKYATFSARLSCNPPFQVAKITRVSRCL
jgi:hypothetical protein